jgi:hypothetical protein
MGYEQYKAWLQGMSEEDLAKEIRKLERCVLMAATPRAHDAWDRMLHLAQYQQARRGTP